MNKSLIKGLVFIILCAYIQPILQNKKYDFQFVNIYFEGDSKINNIIKNDLMGRGNGLIKYDIKFKTEKLKEILSSNEKGDPTVYKIQINISYILFEKNKNILENEISKQIIYNNINDKFELSQYEENVIDNLANNISSEILMSVNTLSK